MGAMLLHNRLLAPNWRPDTYFFTSRKSFKSYTSKSTHTSTYMCKGRALQAHKNSSCTCSFLLQMRVGLNTTMLESSLFYKQIIKLWKLKLCFIFPKKHLQRLYQSSTFQDRKRKQNWILVFSLRPHKFLSLQSCIFSL